MNASKCPRCNLTVYPVEGLKCLDKVWHKGCFKCHECNMTLSLKNYKGFEKRPYCNAHCPQAKATTVADTPEIRRLAENTRLQSQAKYHEDFEKSKGKGFTAIADDPETLRIKNTSKIISNVAYHGELERKKQMEEMRVKGGDESIPVTRINNQIDSKLRDVGPKEEKTVSKHQSQIIKSPVNQKTNNAVPLQVQKQHYIKDGRRQDINTQYDYKLNNNNLESQIKSHYVQTPQQHEQSQALLRQQQQQRQLNEMISMNRSSQQHSVGSSNKQSVKQQQHQQQQHLQFQQQQQQQQQLQQQQIAAAMRNKQITSQISPQAYPTKYTQLNQMTGQVMNQPIMQPSMIRPMVQVSMNGRMPIAAVPSHISQINMPILYQGQLAPMHNNVMQKQGQPYFVQVPHNMMPPNQISQLHQMNQAINHSQQMQFAQQQQQQQQLIQQQQIYKRIFRAMYDYQAQDIDEVSFCEGDILVNCISIDNGWMQGTVQRSGQTGLLPANYVEQIKIKA